MIRKHALSIKNAFWGMVWAFKTQPNYRVHFLFSVISLIGCYFLKVSYTEFLLILLIIFIGFMVEAINTAIEETANAIDIKWREDIKLAKDVSSAAMLIFSLGALIIGIIIFLPKLLVLM